MPPNILLIVLDAARRDAVEPYGAPPGTTPAIAQLARRGSALTRAYATASWTLPSHASMFTGMLPRALGLTQAPGGAAEGARRVVEGLSDRLIATRLRNSSYATHGISTNLWASSHVGLDTGFDTFDYVATARQDRLNGLIGDGSRATLAWAIEGVRSNSDDGAASARRKLLHSIGCWSGKPTFWFVNLVECHSPYLPPRPWNDLPLAERLRAGLEAKQHLNFFSICQYIGGRHEISDGAFGRMRHLYKRAISYMDEWIADALEALDARGILDETLVIVTSDHGENFGEDGLIAHGFSLDERLIHVPLVMAGPGALDDEGVFTLAELPLVLAGAAEIEEHAERERLLPAGVAVAQYDPMAKSSDARMQEFADKLQLDDRGLERLSMFFTSATDGRHKLLVRNGVEYRYDLGNDPGETAPLVPSSNDADGAFTKLRAALEHPAVTASAGPPERETSAPLASAEGELASIERQMKLLGYM